MNHQHFSGNVRRDVVAVTIDERKRGQGQRHLFFCEIHTMYGGSCILDG